RNSHVADEAVNQEPVRIASSVGKYNRAVRMAWFDPTGYVKGWSISEAGKIIEKYGYKTYCISAGGDILAKSNSDKIWNISIQDPKNKSGILNELKIKNGAIATSGSYERGSHIINPKSGRTANKFLSVTVTGPDIVTADVFATAIFASGNLQIIRNH